MAAVVLLTRSIHMVQCLAHYHYGFMKRASAMPMPHPKPEIMSPAGYWPQLHAAIEAGADAVYFGLKHFTARAVKLRPRVYQGLRPICTSHLRPMDTNTAPA